MSLKYRDTKVKLLDPVGLLTIVSHLFGGETLGHLLVFGRMTPIGLVIVHIANLVTVWIMISGRIRGLGPNS